ncbi:hypothetical protein A2899_01250 [Candidatus Amesbacteria bacterium RIFCSPLOWO2_01_FULL_49_25]|uniref:Uncharacterized protein n=1 Tax=Candidatus Amesbacteria bacterium RIFCSPHIGHO2_01_FULL_48_32b TaxID=1797253 RepID=A0A1F4YFJ0_9BACT|nr:MAG: hypothetical protein A2876_03095 [Candidatus Amesbacteria bacterium RIFCSPHIGHO2_01_FULL_48_32b]OGD07779.1 MAG: hypothetical protein A2899_01250 [Candidatus Amesbacteria bacterium RIFCSPLOWO2_01_FULL_49_25]
MHCPDCGEPLHEFSFVGNDKSWRCFRCGGFWADGWVINRLDSKILQKWKPVEVDPGWLNLGSNVCPVDGTQLVRYTGEIIPDNMTVKRCERCGRWWFPTDSLLRYKPAQEAKVNYYRQWGKAADVGSLALPALVLLIVLAGLATVVSLVKRNTGGRVAAQATVRNLAAADGGSGEMWIVWSSAAGYKVKWRRVGEPEWRVGEPERKEEGVYVLKLRDLEQGAEYEAVVEEKGIKFRVD